MAKNFFKMLGQSMSDTGRDMANEGKRFAEITRLSSTINARKKREQECYFELGKLYFDLAEKYDIPELRELTEELAEILRDIENCQKSIRDLKGLTLCTSCGAEIGMKEPFCSACGARNELVPMEESPRCPVCHAPLQKGDMFCNNCGHRIEETEEHPELPRKPETVNCPDCGTENDAGNLFCRACGHRFGGNAEQEDQEDRDGSYDETEDEQPGDTDENREDKGDFDLDVF